MTDTPRGIAGCVLAGGRGTRFGGLDKGLLDFAGRPLVAHVVARLAPQVDDLLISANRNTPAYAELGRRIVSDAHGDFAGPLAGMAAALRVTAAPLLMVAPCDSPFLPDDLVSRLHAGLAAAGANLATVRTGPWLQPVFALLSRELLPDLDAYLLSGGRKIDAWYARHACAEVDFGEDCAAFTNINSAPELAAALREARRS